VAGQHVTLHLDPVRSAANLHTLIEALAYDPAATFASYAEILACVRRDYDYTDRTEPLSLARLLGLLAEFDGRLALSPTARAIYAMRPSSRMDVLHFLLLTAWSRSRSDALALSWAYRAFCEHLWDRVALPLSSTEVKGLVADLLSRAAEPFPDAERIAFSAKSVLGMRKWLEPLDPPVLHPDGFRRRDVCSRELLLLAVGHLAWEEGTTLGIDLLLTPAQREAICRICLLEPTVLDRRLDQLMPTYPRIISPGTRTGPYGRFIRLHALPEIASLAG
jgi:hypothetical protein